MRMSSRRCRDDQDVQAAGMSHFKYVVILSSRPDSNTSFSQQVQAHELLWSKKLKTHKMLICDENKRTKLAFFNLIEKSETEGKRGLRCKFLH